MLDPRPLGSNWEGKEKAESMIRIYCTKKESQAEWCVLVIPAQGGVDGRGRHKGLWGSLASQFRLLSEFQAK